VPNGNNPGTYLHANFAAAFANGLQIGSQVVGAASDNNTTAGNQAALFTSAQAITDWLPHGGPSGALGGDTVDPDQASDPDDGTLAGQTAALTLSVGFDLYDPAFSPSATHLKDLIVTSGAFAGQTVQFVLDTCNAILSGDTTTGYTAAQANAAATAINENFDNGSANGGTDNGFLECDDCDNDDQAIVTFEGRKFEDLNGDGDDEAGGDPGLAGWKIDVQFGAKTFTVESGNSYTYDYAAGTLTDIGDLADGRFLVTVSIAPADLGAGLSYSVSEQQQAGWTQTAGDGDLVQAGFQPYAGTLNDGDAAAGLVFGNFENVTITGTKWEDHDGDGTRDVGDQGLEGWTILVNGQDVGVVTDANGDWTYTAGPGTYSFQEAQAGQPWGDAEDDFTQTYGNSGYGVTVGGGGIQSGGTSTGNDFGNFENVVLSGTKWEDHDGNGVRDPGDQGLAGWTINVGSQTATTDADGNWSIVVGPGTFAIQEAQTGQPWGDAGTGFTQTYGNAGYSVTTSSGTPVGGNDFGNFENFDLTGKKFYDADLDGCQDAGEPGINGWNFGLDTDGDDVPDLFAVTAGNTPATGGTFTFANLGPGTYKVFELSGLSGTWVATTPEESGPFVGSSGDDVNAGVFGNVKLGAGGGHTIGFWGNKNGQDLIGADDLACLTGLNLRDANGNHFDPANKGAVKTWLRDANAVNMAYMLSAQLAAMKLNVHNGFVDGNDLVYAPGVNGAVNGFISISALMAEANAALGADGYTPSGDVNRAYQEVLKNALDAANNNQIFLLLLDAWNDSDHDGVMDPGEI